jgi:hypothetical protein
MSEGKAPATPKWCGVPSSGGTARSGVSRTSWREAGSGFRHPTGQAPRGSIFRALVGMPW